MQDPWSFREHLVFSIGLALTRSRSLLRRLLREHAPDDARHTTGWPNSSWASAMMCRLEQVIVKQVADRAPVAVGGEHEVAEGSLMQPPLD
jgi:hypothetical protein